ncbi:MAG: hypothetical protein CMC93_00500 [Flavobacteriaceae bacterium]|nr:hypothetical protein [Flavobacteriaceae bacterium]|tara:strand:+ start:1994 stop:2536 length:543 start_codon:yes stop_codon:yes gene_type:complete
MSIVKNNFEVPTTKVAFCGSMGSGKTYASTQLQLKTNAKIMSIARPIKELVSRMNLKDAGRGEHIMVGTVGRSIDNNIWINKLIARIDGDVIVDDVRFENEAKVLKENGFTIIYLNVPWHVRFKRVLKRSDDLRDHIQYFANESETACETIDKRLFDYVCTTESQVDEVIENMGINSESI